MGRQPVDGRVHLQPLPSQLGHPGSLAGANVVLNIGRNTGRMRSPVLVLWPRPGDQPRPVRRLYRSVANLRTHLSAQYSGHDQLHLGAVDIWGSGSCSCFFWDHTR
jgi:hypothetical protein